MDAYHLDLDDQSTWCLQIGNPYLAFCPVSTLVDPATNCLIFPVSVRVLIVLHNPQNDPDITSHNARQHLRPLHIVTRFALPSTVNEANPSEVLLATCTWLGEVKDSFVNHYSGVSEVKESFSNRESGMSLKLCFVPSLGYPLRVLQYLCLTCRCSI